MALIPATGGRGKTFVKIWRNRIWQKMKLKLFRDVQGDMVITRRTRLLTACLLGTGACAVSLAPSAYGSGFTAFAEDEDVCRQAGTAAVNGGSGPAAAQRYDFAYQRCMAAHGRMRQMGAYHGAGRPGPGYAPGSSYNFEYPHAFYGIPYATPGYGYDGFSY